MARSAYLLTWHGHDEQPHPVGLFENMNEAMMYAHTYDYRYSIAAGSADIEDGQQYKWVLGANGVMHNFLLDGSWTIHRVAYRRAKWG